MSKKINTLDDLYDTIGGFGRFQFFAVSVICVVEIPTALIFMLPLFVGVNPDTWRCYSASGDQSADDYYEIKGTTNPALCLCNGTLDGGDTTIVSEWNLVCGYAWVTDVITSVQMAGMLFGGIFGAQIADWFGRKKTMYSTCLIMLCMGCVSGFTGSPFLYAAARFFFGTAASTFLLLSTIYPMELLTPRWRALCGAIGPWSEGTMALALLAYYVHPWKALTLAASVPMALTLLTYPFIPESPRWLLNKGKVLEAQTALNCIARWNGRPAVSEEIVKNLAEASNFEIEAASTCSEIEPIPVVFLVNPLHAHAAKSKEALAKKAKVKGSGYLEILKSPHLRLKILIFSGIWFAISLIYYSIMFNVKNLSGNPYLNVVLLGLVDSIGFRSAVFANNWLGRRKALLAYMLLGCAPLLGIVAMELQLDFIPYDETLVTFLSLSSKLFIGGGWGAVKCFTGESFSTADRSTAFGFMTIAAAVGGMMGPQMAFLATIYRPTPYFVAGALAVMNIGLSLILEETEGKPLDQRQES